MKTLNKNPVFKFCSSVKLAIPLLILLLIASVIGTLIESRYNAEVANIQIYSATWFIILLCLLWINIFCATISRIPFKKHHTGFIITHIGLLSLLIGSIMTKLWGIDGSIQIQEKTQSRYVSLPELVYEVGRRGSPGYSKISFTRALKPLAKSDLEFLNKSSHPLFAVNYKPFVEPPKLAGSHSSSGEGALQFKLASEFFNVDQSLHISENPELRMGPALIRYVETKSLVEKKEKKKKPSKNKKAPQKVIEIVEISSGRVIKTVPLSSFSKKSFEVKGTTFEFVKSYEQAMVVNNKLDEGGQEGVNPALEIRIQHNGEQLRDILYAKFPDFSLLSNSNLPFSVRYIHPSMGAIKDTTSSGPKLVPSGNVIEFVRTENENEVDVVLFKNQKEVLSKRIKVGEEVETPWMGMKITLTSMGAKTNQAQDNSNEVVEIEMPFKAPLPGSALKVSTVDGSSTWLFENQPQSLLVNGKEVDVYFGRNSINLPFSIYLEKFYKKDYPGSTTPMSYESDVKVNGTGELIKIAMNEPLKHGGYTFYQSSYILQPGRPPVTVLSVNKDPGRWVKYSGSLILCLGIVVYTLMRSRVYKKAKTND